MLQLGERESLIGNLAALAFATGPLFRQPGHTSTCRIDVDRSARRSNRSLSGEFHDQGIDQSDGYEAPKEA